MAIDVLFVDDYLPSAKSYARLIEIKTGLNTFATDEPDVALEKVRTEQIKVVVLDQGMPGITGINLFRKIKEIDKSVKAILFSGNLTISVAEEAIKAGFRKCLSKFDIQKLPGIVFSMCKQNNQKCKRR